MIKWIIYAVIAVVVLLYCKYGKSVGHIPDPRKPLAFFGLSIYTIVMLIVLVVTLCSCRTQYVPVETIRTEYRYADRMQHDSIYQHDSTMIYRDGDTVYLNRYKYRYKYLYINKVDSFVKTDSVQVPYPVEKRLTRWQSMKMELGGWAFGGLLFVLIIVGWLVYRNRNK